MYKRKIKWMNVLLIGTVIYSIAATYQIHLNNELISQQIVNLKDMHYKQHNKPLQLNQEKEGSKL